MTLQALKQTFLTALDGQYSKDDILSIFYLLVAHQLGLSKVDIALDPGAGINSTSADFFKEALTELKTEKPVQYIIGKTDFYGLTFNVNKHVLIPRPETEELVAWIVKDIMGQKKRFESQEPGTGNQELATINHQPSTKILDIGTGSGCIAVSLAKNIPNAMVYALDVSPKALDVARDNALTNKVAVHFIEADILDANVILNEPESILFDIIVSNPPYVRNLEKMEIKKNVLAYEPHSALFVHDEDHLIFYEAIANFAKKHLKENGKLYLEINQYLAKETLELLTDKGYKHTKLRKDLFGNDRMIKASF